MAGSVRWYAGSATGRGDRRAVGVAPAGATRHESRRYALGAGLASRLYYINFIFEQNPAVLVGNGHEMSGVRRVFPLR